MSWRDQYRQGSWRGISFTTYEQELSGGRRGQTHEFPQRDVPWREDLGKLGRTITIECFVAGDDYYGARDALIDACEKEGPGTLVYPTRGEMTLALISYSCSESSVSGGIAEFSLEFVETSGTPVSAEARPATAAQSRMASAAVVSKAPERFAERFTTSGFPAFVEDAGVRLVEGVALATQIAAAPLGGAGAVLRAFDTGMRLLPASARALVRGPLALGHALTGLIGALDALAGSSRRRLATARTLLDYGASLKPVIGTTPSRTREHDNQLAFVTLVKTTAAAHYVGAAADIDFISYDEAVLARDDGAARLDALADLLADAFDDIGWRDTNILNAALVRDLTARGATLARTYRHTPAATEPALVTARRLFDRTADIATRAGEIAARNHIRHPGFVPGGRALAISQELAA